MEGIGIKDDLDIFIKSFADDLYSLELLLFFSRHPNAQFNRTAVLHAVTTKKFDTGIALKNLIDKKLVMVHAENGIMLYALTKDEPAHSLASQLVTIDQRQWQIILGHLLDANGI